MYYFHKNVIVETQKVWETNHERIFVGDLSVSVHMDTSTPAKWQPYVDLNKFCALDLASYHACLWTKRHQNCWIWILCCEKRAPIFSKKKEQSVQNEIPNKSKKSIFLGGSCVLAICMKVNATTNIYLQRNLWLINSSGSYFYERNAMLNKKRNAIQSIALLSSIFFLSLSIGRWKIFTRCFVMLWSTWSQFDGSSWWKFCPQSLSSAL